MQAEEPSGERLPPGVENPWTPPGEQERVPSGRAQGPDRWEPQVT